MRNLYIAAAIVLGLASCGESEKTSIEELKLEKDSLKVEFTRIKEEIALVDEQLAKLDTDNVKLKIVTTQPVKVGSFEHYFIVHGNVDAKENILVYPEAPGRVKKMILEAGSNVKKGQLIAELDASTLELGVSELKTALELSTEVFERQEKLWKKNIGSEIQFLEAKSNKESVEKKLNTLYDQLEMYKIKAPISGYLDEVFPKAGEMAVPQMPFVRIVNTDKVEIKSDISESYISKVVKGDMVKVEVPGSDQKFNSKISTVGSFINPNNRTFKTTIKLNDGLGLKPNQLAKIHVRDFMADSVVLIPSRIIQEDRQGNQYIYLFKNDKVDKVDIVSEWSYEGVSLVKSGLSGNEIFVDKGCRSVQEGEQVKVIQ